MGKSDQGEFEILSNSGKTCTIRFVNTGYVRAAKRQYVIRGALKDPYFPSKYGIGYLGVGPYKTSSDELLSCGKKYKANNYYSVWATMFSRCYNTSNYEYHSYGGAGVYVSENWKCFQNFAEFFCNNWKEGLELDKDILVQGNKEYGPDSCVFVPAYLNNLVKNRESENGYPTGVGVYKGNKGQETQPKNPFIAWADGRRLGYFSKPMEAHKAWQEAKADKIFESVNRYSEEKFFDTRVADALLSKAWKLKTDAQLGIETIRL